MAASTYIYGFVFAVTVTAASPARSGCEISQAMLPLQEAVQSFQDNVPQEDAKLGKLSDNITESSSKLRLLLPRSPNAVPQSFCRSLAALGSILSKAITNAPSNTPIIESVADDLNLKVDFLSKNLALTTPRYEIAVTVSTKLNGADVSGYMVSANPLLYDGSTEPLFAFPKLSSPTTMALPPGKYVIAASQGAQINCRRQLDVGLSGERDLSTDCPLQ